MINLKRMGPGRFTLGESDSLTNFSALVTKLEIVPEVKTEDPQPVLSGDFMPGDRTEAYTIRGEMKQDFGENKSITEWTWANQGKEFPFLFVPNSANDKGIKGTVVVEAVTIGGDVGATNSTTFEWVCTSRPTISDSIPLAG